MTRPRRSADISPTAHYTGYVWTRHGLSHPAFATAEGRLFFNTVRPALALSRALGGPTLEGLLLARHRLIDHELRRSIDDGRVTQILELAAGLSPRGWRFAREYGDRIRYIEADLPGMAARKRRLLQAAGGGGANHRVLDIDAFAETGAASLAVIAKSLDRHRGLAIITEGLINYFPTAAITGLWARIARTLAGFPHGLHLSDLHLADDDHGATIKTFVRILSVFVRGRVHLHFSDADEAVAALGTAGFDVAELLRPSDFSAQFPECFDPAAKLVHVIEARTRHANVALLE